MRRNHFLLLLTAIALLAVGFAAGHFASQNHLFSAIEFKIRESLPKSNKTAQEQPKKNPVPQNQPIISQRNSPPVNYIWPEAEKAVDYWKSIEARRSGVNLNDAGGQAKAALNQMIEEADTLSAKGDNYKALEKMRQALELGADDASAWLKFADLSRRANNISDALNAYLIAEARSPSQEQSARLYNTLADIYEKRGDSATPLAILALQKSLDIKADPALRQRLDILRGQELELLSVETHADSDTPEACITFSWALRDDGSVAYEDFIQAEPPVKLAAVATDKQLCLKGFAYGQDYKLTFKSGFPASGQSKLPGDKTRTVSFDSRSPALSFQSGTYILPRLNNSGVPLRSVNVDVAKVEILQINDRNLVSQIIAGRALDDDEVYSYSINQLRDNYGRSLWSGFINLKRADNQNTSTAIPFASVIKDPKPGLYAVVAQMAKKKTASDHDDNDDDNPSENKNDATDPEYEESEYAESAIQWLVVTDVGLTAYQGQDGLRIMARSYESGKPLSGIKLRLLSRDNAILAEAATDSSGHAKFDDALLKGTGGKEAKLLQAFGGQGDFTFLDLNQPALDLSDRGVGGRDAPEKLDVFLYSDRGIYRPGENLYLSALLRDTKADALETAPPLTLKIFRPDGVIFKQELISANDTKLGGYHTTFSIPDNARMGVWRADVFADPTEPSIGSYSWQIEDFVPERLDVKISLPDNAALKANDPMQVPIQADYLYGAPASNAKGDAGITLRLADDSFRDKYKDYRFGLLDAKFTTRQIDLSLPKTDAKGASAIDIKLEQIPPTSHPLEALLRAGVFDDSGRAVNRTAILPVSRTQPYLGLKMVHKENDSSAGEDDDWNFSANRTFAVIAVNREGAPVTQNNLRYRLVEEHYYYDWFTARSERNYQRQIRDIPVKTGDISINTDKPTEISFSNLDYGTYRLEIFNPEETGDRLTAVSMRFNVGWTERSPTSQDKPDSLQLRLDKPEYRPGDKAQLFIKAPFAGQAELVLARENVIEQRLISVPKEGAVITLPVSDQWGAGIYALVHAYRPGQKLSEKAKDQTMPGRAVGVIWLGMDPAPRTLDIKFDIPEQIKPRQTLNVPVDVANANGKAEITITAVDEGILQLTDFKSPNPENYLYAKRKLGVDIRDAYGRLLDPSVDAVGQIRNGGDQAGRSSASLPNKWIKSVSLFSGPVALDEQGHATIPLEIPDFNGKLRLMAVAYNTNQVGHAEEKIIVRDPVVVNLGLPRFLAPKDKATITLNLDNLDGPAGMAGIQFKTTGGIAIGDYPKELKLGEKQKQQVKLTLNAETSGPASLQLALTLPDGTTRYQTWDLTVRPIQTYQTNIRNGILKPDEKLTLDSALLETVLPEDAIVTFSSSTVPDLQLARVIKQLDRYPYGCLEQTSSRLLPLLYLRDVIEQAGLEDKKAPPPDSRINKAIQHILSMQKGNGAFSLWTGYGPTEDFLSLYAIDVLQRAQAQGYNVPDYALRRALTWLQNELRTGDFETPYLHRRAYGYYLLARAGLVEPGQVRYFAERYGGQFESRLANAFTAAALAQINDSDHAAPFWAKALDNQKDQEDSHSGFYYDDYGSTIRNQLIVLTLAAESGQPQENITKFAAQISGNIAREEYFSTQENGWVILASHALYKNQGTFVVTLNEEELPVRQGKPALKSWQGPDWSAFKKGQVIQNKGKQDLYYSVAVNAIPKAIQPPVSNGLKIERRFYTSDGKQIDLSKIEANQMVIAVIDGEVTDNQVKDQALVVDLLPAGLELESAKFGNGQNVEEFSWIGALTVPEYQELRDDRFVAAFDPASLTSQATRSANEDNNDSSEPLPADHFRFAYAARAVTKGRYQLPATQVEAMYQPEFHALTSPAEIVIENSAEE